MGSHFHRTALLTCVLATACGAESIEQYHQDRQPIIGGVVSNSTDYPAVGVLLAIGRDQYGMDKAWPQCTGSLIAPDVVLTAAHCTFPPPNFQSMTLYFSFALDVTYFGQTNSELPADAVEVVQLYYHKDFDQLVMSQPPDGLGDHHDVGIAVLESKITDRPPAVVLQPDSGLVTEQTEVIIVGYGLTEVTTYPNQSKTAVKHHATSVINEVGNSEMQVGITADTTPQKCHGDSGGPSFLEVADDRIPVLRIAGITSRAYDQVLECQVGGTDTRADEHWDWIDGVMRKACDDGLRSDCDSGGGLPIPADATDGGTVTDGGDPPDSGIETDGSAGTDEANPLPDSDDQPDAGQSQAADASGQEPCNPTECECCGCSAHVPVATSWPLVLLLVAFTIRRSHKGPRH